MSMKVDQIASILNPQTPNLMTSGGGGFDAIIAGDIAGVMMACEADPLIWSYLFSYFDIGLSYDRFTPVDVEFKKTPIKDRDGTVIAYKVRSQEVYKRETVSNSLEEFKEKLKPWIYKNYLEWCIRKGKVKPTEKAAEAVEELPNGLAMYLSKTPLRETRIAAYFKPMHHNRFQRSYKLFVIQASRQLYGRLSDLCRQIDRYTRKND